MHKDPELMLICLREHLDDVLSREMTGSEAEHTLNVTYLVIRQIEALFDSLPANVNDQVRETFAQTETERKEATN